MPTSFFSIRRNSWLPFFVGAALLLTTDSRAEFPDAGVDAFDSTMTIELNVPMISGSDISLDLEGPVVVTRGTPDTSDPCTIETELIAMSLTGFDAQLGEVKVALNPDLESLGEVVSDGTGCTFPASSFYDVFVQISVASLGFDLINLEPVRVEGTINSLPPIFDTYTHPPPAIPLVSILDPNGPQLATILGESSHRPVQEPTLSVKTGGPTGLDAAELHDFGNPPPVGLSRPGLGLQATDDIDAVSYGLDVIDSPNEQDGGEMSIAFSVDKDAIGQANSGVNREATQPMGHEAEGDEFVATFNGSNLELVDEQAITLQPGDDDGDDLDALTNEPTSYADAGADLVPDRPVFFSLAPGSQTLTDLGVSPASILYSLNGNVGVYASAAAMGLAASDDLDALCLMKAGLPSSVTVIPGLGPPGVPESGGATQFDYAIFSLAKNSPSLVSLGASPGDLFVTDFSTIRSPGTSPAIFSTADQIGLRVDDELNALKCLMQVAIIPIYGSATTNGTLLINVGGISSLVADPSGSFPKSYDSNSYGVWSMINPAIAHFHGPYVHPASPLASILSMTQLDPLTVGFGASPGDICPLFHKHGSFEEKGDPDGPGCGHGMFVPHRGPATPIVPGFEAFTVALNVIQSLDSLIVQFPELYRAATLHRVGIAFIQALSGAGGNPKTLREASAPNLAAGTSGGDPYVIIITGTGRTKIDITLDGADGLTLGPVLSTLPVPEPSRFGLGIAAIATLASLRSFRSRRRG
jgi:hypothetical protein